MNKKENPENINTGVNTDVREDMNLLLSVRGLTISFPEGNGRHEAVRDLSFDLHKGDIVGVVGESGSGKSMTALAMMGLLPKSASIDRGEIFFKGRNLFSMTPEERRSLRGAEMAMVFQEPMTSLNPVMRIEEQVGENLELHTDLSKDEIHKRVVEALEAVGINDAEQSCRKYPHELSGGQRQRVMLALATICSPDLLIADEPTTALDVVVQEQILRLLMRINLERGISIMFISHDLNVVKRLCDRVVVVYQGELVEQGLTDEVLYHPKHEYTKKLVSQIPLRDDLGAKTETVMSLQNLNVFYDIRGGLFRKKGKKHVIHDMSFNLHDGEILGVVGESGCGKSTLCKAIIGLHKDYTGIIWTKPGLRPQMVFQDPFSSLNPAHTVEWIMEEPLKVRGIAASERKQRVAGMLTEVGLDPSYAERKPRELSGGQRQRISIGTALLMESGFIIADEPVSALDVTVQSQIVKLLLRLHEEKNMTMMFISHDLDMVRRICRRVLVVYRGEIVEGGRSEEVYGKPAHPYTRMLLKATQGEGHDEDAVAMNALPVKVPDDYPGCPFYPRCEQHCDRCAHEKPPMVELPGNHAAKCFRIAEG